MKIVAPPVVIGPPAARFVAARNTSERTFETCAGVRTMVIRKQFVSYRRVSTARQGQSGLGLEAQADMIARHVAAVGGTLIQPEDRPEGFVEVESGKRVDRPELRRALAFARKRRATLIVAKLDRLARNVRFVSALLETPGVEFSAADFPQASRMMIQMMAVFGEYEREMISKRTREALAARRRRGLPLGTPRNLVHGNAVAPQLNRARARAEAERMRPIIERLKQEGFESTRELADELNRRGYTTARGLEFHPMTVARVLRRLDGGRSAAVAALGWPELARR